LIEANVANPERGRGAVFRGIFACRRESAKRWIYLAIDENSQQRRKRLYPVLSIAADTVMGHPPDGQERLDED